MNMCIRKRVRAGYLEDFLRTLLSLFSDIKRLCAKFGNSHCFIDWEHVNFWHYTQDTNKNKS